MKVVCAWCLHEGKPGDLGEREPLQDGRLTHSICAGHMGQLLEGLPSRSFPDVAVLIIVRPNDDAALFESLQGLFTGPATHSSGDQYYCDAAKTVFDLKPGSWLLRYQIQNGFGGSCGNSLPLSDATSGRINFTSGKTGCNTSFEFP
jgi:hypothetical protein